MTEHKMKLQAKYYDFIHNGTKRVELRLYDEKRRKIKLGDEIEFTKSETDKFTARVVALYLYKNFAELVSDFPIELLADKSMTKGGCCSLLMNSIAKMSRKSLVSWV